MPLGDLNANSGAGVATGQRRAGADVLRSCLSFMTFLQCSYVAALRNGFKIKPKLSKALFGKQGTLASYPNCDVLQIFPKEKLRVPLQAPAPPMPPVGGQLGRDWALIISRGSSQEDGLRDRLACLSVSHASTESPF